MVSNLFLWGAVSVVFTTVQYVPYFRGVFRGKFRPHTFSWLVWGVLAGINFFAQVATDAGPGAWAGGYTALLSLGVFFVSFKHGEKSIVLIDWITMVCALLAIVLWVTTKDPLNATLLATFASCLGWIPTVRKSIQKPHQESIQAYSVSMLKWLCSIFAIQSLSLTTLLAPLASLVTGISFIIFMAVRRAQLKQPS